MEGVISIMTKHEKIINTKIIIDCVQTDLAVYYPRTALVNNLFDQLINQMHYPKLTSKVVNRFWNLTEESLLDDWHIQSLEEINPTDLQASIILLVNLINEYCQIAKRMSL